MKTKIHALILFGLMVHPDVVSGNQITFTSVGSDMDQATFVLCK